MSTTATTGSLSAGVQQLYNDGLLPSNLNAATLNGASTSQLNSIVQSTIESKQFGTLLGLGTSSDSDTVSLSSTATATTDPLTAAVNNSLTSTLNAAASKFLDSNQPTTGSNVNVVG